MAETIILDIIDAGFLGRIGIAVSPTGLRRLRMFVGDDEEFLVMNQAFSEGEYYFDPHRSAPFRDQIGRYLRRELEIFSFPIDWSVYTPFQEAVLRETLAIPYGETRSYGQVAAAVGKPKASRAVGQAEKSNQAPLVIPCHRVIGADGSLTGYGGPHNIDLKASLLGFERGE